jgi:hypothetical protein
VTKHRTPWAAGVAKVQPLADDTWELYDGNADWTQARDLAAEQPEKLAELQRLFLLEAARYNVFPLDDRVWERLNPDIAGRPTLVQGDTQVLFQGMGRLNENCVLNMRNKSHSITAELAIPDQDARGVIVNQGGTTGGLSLYVNDGCLCYGYSFCGFELTTVAADPSLPAGTHQVPIEFAYDGGGLGKGGDVTLFVDGDQVGPGRIPRTHPLSFSLDETTDVGRDTGAPVTPDYPVGDKRLHRHGPLGPPGGRRRQPRPPHRRPRPAPPGHDQTVVVDHPRLAGTVARRGCCRNDRFCDRLPSLPPGWLGIPRALTSCCGTSMATPGDPIGTIRTAAYLYSRASRSSGQECPWLTVTNRRRRDWNGTGAATSWRERPRSHHQATLASA